MAELAFRISGSLVFVGGFSWMLFFRANQETERLFKLKKCYHLTKKTTPQNSKG